MIGSAVALAFGVAAGVVVGFGVALAFGVADGVVVGFGVALAFGVAAGVVAGFAVALTFGVAAGVFAGFAVALAFGVRSGVTVAFGLDAGVSVVGSSVGVGFTDASGCSGVPGFFVGATVPAGSALRSGSADAVTPGSIPGSCDGLAEGFMVGFVVTLTYGLADGLFVGAFVGITTSTSPSSSGITTTLTTHFFIGYAVNVIFVFPGFFPVIRIFFLITFTEAIFRSDTLALIFLVPAFLTLIVIRSPFTTVTFVLDTLIFAAADAVSIRHGDNIAVKNSSAASRVDIDFFFI